MNYIEIKSHLFAMLRNFLRIIALIAHDASKNIYS